MNENEPSWARRASVMAMALLAMLVAVPTITLGSAFFYQSFVAHDRTEMRTTPPRESIPSTGSATGERESPEPEGPPPGPSDELLSFTLLAALRPFVLAFCVGSILGAPLLVRLARIRKLWQASTLTIAAGVLAAIPFFDHRADILGQSLRAILPAAAWMESLNFRFSTLAIYLPVHMAVLCLLWRLSRRKTIAHVPSDDLLPGPREEPGQWHRFGSPPEIRTFSMITVAITVIAGGGWLAIGEMLIRQVPSEVWRALREPGEMTLLTLKSSGDLENKRGFHGYEIVDRVAVLTSRERAIVNSSLKRSIARWQGAVWLMMFDASHGIRVTDGTKTYDILISYQSQQLVVCKGDEAIAGLGFRGSSEALDQLLRAANVPVPAR